MRNRYIMLLDGTPDAPAPGLSRLTEKLKDLGLETQHHIQGACLFTSKHTPVLPLPGGAVLLGEVYDRHGRRGFDPEHFQRTGSQRELRQHLLDDYWGEYLFIQPSDNDTSSTIVILRDPSGGLGCAYSLEHGFVASDPSLPSRLGLYSKRVDWEFVRHCLTYSHAKMSRTGLAGIRELLPGCALEIAPGSTRIHMAWSPWHFVSKDDRLHDPAMAAEAIRAAITTVVHAMAETDGSLLLQLSGGLDSSIVGVSLKNARARICACTAISPLPGADERHYASQITSQLGVDLLQVPLDFSQAPVQFPLPESSLRPAVSPLAYVAGRAMDIAVSREHVNAIYSGGGGDTVFSYLRSAAPAADAYLSAGLATGWRSTVDLARLHGCILTKAARLTLRKLVRPPKSAYKPDFALLKEASPAPLEFHPWFAAPAHTLPGDRERVFDLAGNQLFAEVMLRNDDCHVRMPLLAQPVMEACLRVPSWLWISGGQNRAIARSAFSDLLPKEVLNRRSKGSFMNYNASLYRRNKELMRRFLLEGRINAHGLLDPDKLNVLMNRPPAARDQSFLRIFDLCMVENWVRQHA